MPAGRPVKRFIRLPELFRGFRRKKYGKSAEKTYFNASALGHNTCICLAHWYILFSDCLAARRQQRQTILCFIISSSDLNRIPCVSQIDEIDSFYHPAIVYIQAGDDPLRKHIL